MISVDMAIPGDLVYLDHLQRKNAEELAFYPKQAFEREIEKGRILLARVNNEPAGYLYHGAFGKHCKIHQACIEYDLRGQMYGAALVGWLIDMCSRAGVLSIHLRCGSDIQANGFWQWMGFYCEAIKQGGVRRMRDINCWRYDCSPALFTTEIVPSEKAQDASIWRGRSVSAGSQFIRGKAMDEYRKMVIKGSAE